MSDLERAFLRATRKAVYTEGKPGNLGRADGATVYFVLPDASTDYSRVWARYNNGNSPAIEVVVRNGGVPPVIGLPVRIIERNGEAVAVIETDAALINAFTGGGNWFPMEPHGPTHRRLGTDPRYVEGLAFEELLVRPSSPPALTVYVTAGWYRYGGVRNAWEGGDSGSLSAYVPASSGARHFVIIALDRSTNTIVIVDGSDFGGGGGDIYTLVDTAVTYAEIKAIAIADAYYPLAVVVLYFGQTSILPPDITHDLRAWGGDSGGALTTADFDKIMTDANYDVMVDANGNVMIGA